MGFAVAVESELNDLKKKDNVIVLLYLKSKYSWKEYKDFFVPWSLICLNEAHLGQ